MTIWSSNPTPGHTLGKDENSKEVYAAHCSQQHYFQQPRSGHPNAHQQITALGRCGVYIQRNACFLITKYVQLFCNLVDCSLPGSPVHGFFRQEYWSRLPFPSPGNLPNPEIKSTDPALAGRFFTAEPLGKPTMEYNSVIKKKRKKYCHLQQHGRTREYHTKWSKSDRERQILYHTPYTGVAKIWTRLSNWTELNWYVESKK